METESYIQDFQTYQPQLHEYTVKAPEAYLNDNTKFEENEQTWDQVAHVDADEVKREGIALARQAEHQLDSIRHRTPPPHNGEPVAVVPPTLIQKRRQQLMQQEREDQEMYDHGGESSSVIVPWV